MSKYRGFSASHWDEPEYTTQTLQNVAAYLICAADIVGVVGVNVKNTSRKLKVSGPKFERILKHLESIGKLERSSKHTHVWWKSAMFYSLYKGNYSPNQLKSVQTLLKRWDFTSTFEQGFANRVVQHYANKYSLMIPIESLTQRVEGQSQSQSQSQSQYKRQSQYPEIGSAYFKKFRKNLQEGEYESLLKQYGDESLLLLMVEHITIKDKSKIENPVGLLIVARGAPGSHLPDNQYDNWKREMWNVTSRNL